MDRNGCVLFVCLHGSAKSLIAMQHFNRLAIERGLGVRALSAGTEPDDAVPLEVVAGLRDDAIDIGDYRPLRVTADLVADAARIVSFGPDLGQLLPRGREVEQWRDMPAVSDDYVNARAAIADRVRMMFER
jgi:arsenate reductase